MTEIPADIILFYKSEILWLLISFVPFRKLFMQHNFLMFLF